MIFTKETRLQKKASNSMHEKDGRIKCFMKLLDEKGFVVQQGRLQYIDILKLVSEGEASTALGNIYGAPYATYLLPPAPNQMPSQGQQPPKSSMLLYAPGPQRHLKQRRPVLLNFRHLIRQGILRMN